MLILAYAAGEVFADDLSVNASACSVAAGGNASNNTLTCNFGLTPEQLRQVTKAAVEGATSPLMDQIAKISKIDIPELTRALDPNALQANRHRHVPAAVIEQPRFLRNANQMARQRPSLDAAALIKLAEMSDRLLDDASAEAHAAHQAPIPMDLSVLLACRAAQIHAPIESESLPSEKTLGRHYTPKSGLPRIPSP